MNKGIVREELVKLEFQNVIDGPPVTPQVLYQQACSNDGITIQTWKEIWIKNVKENHAKFGSFKDKSIGLLFGKHKHMPAILVGSGPSLRHNANELKNKGDIPSVSCLHNFHFLEDSGTPADYYVTLDAGEVTIEEVYEGGSKTPDEYWDLTKNRILLAYIGTSPRLLEKWQGEIYFYNSPVPEEDFRKQLAEIEPFHCYVSTGGNVLGACLYIARGYLGCSSVAFIGADFSFSYEKKFHGWNSKYDKALGYVVKDVDVFGNRVLTWQSYKNFKGWFDQMSMTVPGTYFNCTEGGCLGSYPDGNIYQIKQMKLKSFIEMQNMHELLRGQATDPAREDNTILF